MTKPGVGKFDNYNNSMQQVFDNLEVTQMVNNFPDIYEVRSFIILFRMSSPSFLYRARGTKSVSSHSVCVRTLIMLSSHPFTGVSIYLSLQTSLSKGCMNLLFPLWIPNITPISSNRERINCTLITNHIVMYRPISHIIALSEFKPTASFKQQILYHCKHKTICCIRNSTKESGVGFVFKF
jgi:hypothetical protein